MLQPKNLAVIAFFIFSCIFAFAVANRESIIEINACLNEGGDWNYQASICAKE